MPGAAGSFARKLSPSAAKLPMGWPLPAEKLYTSAPPHSSAGAARGTLPRMVRTALGVFWEKTVIRPPRAVNSCSTSRSTWVRLPSGPSIRASRSQRTSVDSRFMADPSSVHPKSG